MIEFVWPACDTVLYIMSNNLLWKGSIICKKIKIYPLPKKEFYKEELEMKKVLSIVLSIVMVLCMMPAMAFAGTAAAFTDAASIEYTEAVDVLYAAGIIDGMPDGSFVPNGNVTREQAAKLIATVLLGEKAEKLATDVAPFSDVAADRWSAGYIAYGVEKGYLAGVGNGAFDPTGNVTALQLAKMLLSVIGYDATIEGLTGDKWGVNTSVLADDNGLFAGNDAVIVNNAASREEAALYILNALAADMVGYADKGTNVTLPDGTTIVSGASAAATIASTNKNIADNGKLQVAEKYVPKLKYAVTGVNKAFAAPAVSWTYDKKEVGKYASEPILTYTTGVTGGKLYTDLGLTKTKNISDVYNNGSAASAVQAKKDVTSVVVGGNGIVTKVYEIAEDTYRICTETPSFGQVAVATKAETKTTGAYTQYTVGGNAYKVFSTVVDADKDVTKAVITGSVANEDMVLYTLDAVTGTMYIEAVDTVNGICTSIATKDKAATIGGTVYPQSAVAANASPAYVPSIATKAADYYVDSYGNYIAAVTPATPADTYAVVLSAKVAKVLVGDEVKDVNKAVLAFNDGSVATVETKDAFSLDDATTTTVVEKAPLLVKYSVKDDVYTLTKQAADVTNVAYSFSGKIETGKSAVGNSTLKANADTLFVFVDYADDDTTTPVSRKVAGTVTTVTGIAAVETFESVTGYAVNTDAKADGIANVIYVTNDVKASSTSEDWVYVIEEIETNGDGVVYSVLVNGAPSTLTAKDGTIFTSANRFYTNVKYVKGIVDSADIVSASLYTKNLKLSVSGGSLLNDGVYLDDIKADASVYVIDKSEKTVEPMTAAELTTVVEGGMYKIEDKYGVITTLYIIV